MCRVHLRSEHHPFANVAHSEGRQILENWRIKRIIDAKSVENAIATLENRKERYRNDFGAADSPDQELYSIQQAVIKAHGSRSGASQPVISRNEVVKRIEEDRERVGCQSTRLLHTKVLLTQPAQTTARTTMGTANRPL